MNFRLLVISSLCVAGLSACNTHSTTMCTDAPKSDWQDQDAFQSSLLDKGYKINEFKVTDGNCYEIYGFDAQDNKVEIYFNPVDGSIVKQESH